VCHSQHPPADLKDHRKRQAEDRLAAGALWQDHGLVFSSAIGTPLDAPNVRREFRKITEAAGLGTDWAPRDLRHSFVSPVPRTACPSRRSLAWPGTIAPPPRSLSTGTNCALSLRPGAEAMDRILSMGRGQGRS
jgi:hypothetical protein